MKENTIGPNSSREEIMDALNKNERFARLNNTAHYNTNPNRKLYDRTDTYFIKDIQKRPLDILYSFYKIITL